MKTDFILVSAWFLSSPQTEKYERLIPCFSIWKATIPWLIQKTQGFPGDKVLGYQNKNTGKKHQQVRTLQPVSALFNYIRSVLQYLKHYSSIFNCSVLLCLLKEKMLSAL